MERPYALEVALTTIMRADENAEARAYIESLERDAALRLAVLARLISVMHDSGMDDGRDYCDGGNAIRDARRLIDAALSQQKGGA